MTGFALRLAYDLRIHRLAGWALDAWAAMLPMAAAALLLARWLLASGPSPQRRLAEDGWPILPAGHWLGLAALLLAAGAALWLRLWAARRRYGIFLPDASAPPPGPAALDPGDKVKLYATGRFTVQGKSRVFAGLLAYWRTFATREHAVMAIAHASRFLLARRPEADVGMWYLFLKPADIEAITPGRLTTGRVTRPALRVAYRAAASGPSPQRRLAEDAGRDAGRSARRSLAERVRGSPTEGRPVIETADLGFDDEPARARVWADLLAGGAND